MFILAYPVLSQRCGVGLYLCRPRRRFASPYDHEMYVRKWREDELRRTLSCYVPPKPRFSVTDDRDRSVTNQRTVGQCTMIAMIVSGQRPTDETTQF
jgi:hypothetical protein